MKKLSNCKDENCIPTPTSCSEWNGGTIEYLGICDGDSLNNILWEVVTKLQEIAGEDLSQFDIDSLLDICNQKAPLEVDLISILNVLKNNQICLKDFIDTLNERLNELFENTGVNVNLKCYADFDNLGNALSITRDQFDQLVIDNLCSQKGRIETLEGKVISLQSQIDNIDQTATVEELSFATCVNPGVLPTSSQVRNTSDAFCEQRNATGNSTDISGALSFSPSFPIEVTNDPNYIASPSSWAQHYQNLMLAFTNVLARLDSVEECCAADCNDVELGFSAVYSDDIQSVLITFSWGAGTNIPAGFEDWGSTGTITDIDGNVVSFNIEIANNSEAEIPISGLNTLSPLNISIISKMCSGGLTCQKCLTRTVTTSQCSYCTYSATGSTGTAVIVYRINQAD